MPDISMCCNRDCPLRAPCYRYRAVPNPDWQAYTRFEPKGVSPDRVDCEWFASVVPGDRIRSMEEIEEKK